MHFFELVNVDLSAHSIDTTLHVCLTEVNDYTNLMIILPNMSIKSRPTLMLVLVIDLSDLIYRTAQHTQQHNMFIMLTVINIAWQNH